MATVYPVAESTATTGEPSAAATCTPGDVLVLLDIGNYASSSEHITSVTGMGASWSKVAGAQTQVFDTWIGVNPTEPSGTIQTTASTLASGVSNRAIIVYGVSGATAVAAGYPQTKSGGVVTSGPVSVSPGQAVVALGYSDDPAKALSSTSPATGWGTRKTYQVIAGRHFGYQTRGVAAAESVSASAARTAGVVASMVLVVGEAGGATQSSTVSAWESGSRVALVSASLLTGGTRVPLTLAGIYETRPAIYYFDPAPVIAGIDAATTLPDLENALSPLATHSVATFDIAETPTSQDGYTARAATFSDPRLKPFLRYMVDSLAKLASGKIAGNDPIKVIVCGSITDGVREVSGVAFSTSMSTFVSVNQTQYHYDTVGTDGTRAHPGVFMHELAHLMEAGAKDDYLNSVYAMDSGIAAANPAGFTYGTASADAPFTGEHPVGFPRPYGRVSRVEDFADMVAYMTVPALYTDLRRWMESDPHLVEKYRVVKEFLTATGWGSHAIEDMHGGVPHVHPL